MLVVCNGAPKGGSTWQYLLIPYVLPGIQPVPAEFQDKRFRNSSLELDSARLFLKSCDITNDSFYSKNHWKCDQQLELLLNDNRVQFLGIARDIRDVLVSRYFHDVRNRIIPQGTQFYIYYKQRGRAAISHYCSFQKDWFSYAFNHERSLFMMSYEALIADFDAEITRLFLCLTGRAPSSDEIKTAREGTNFTELQKANRGFFRSGISGDWINHLDSNTANDLFAQISENGYLQFLAELKNHNIVVKDDLFFPEWIGSLN